MTNAEKLVKDTNKLVILISAGVYDPKVEPPRPRLYEQAKMTELSDDDDLAKLF